MNPIDLILTICLAVNPDICRTHEVHFLEDGSLIQCTVRAPFYIARWSQEHPEFKVVRWRCEAPDTGKDV